MHPDCVGWVGFINLAILICAICWVDGANPAYDAEVVAWPVGVAYGGADLYMQHAYGDYVHQFGPEAGMKVDGGWSGFWYSTMDHQESQLQQIMSQHQLDYQAAQSYYINTHLK